MPLEQSVRHIHYIYVPNTDNGIPTEATIVLRLFVTIFDGQPPKEISDLKNKEVGDSPLTRATSLARQRIATDLNFFCCWPKMVSKLKTHQEHDKSKWRCSEAAESEES